MNKEDMNMHRALWTSIEQLAARNGWSVSGLARRAGMDLTSFNVSKRFDKKTGHPRYPTFKTINRVLYVTNTAWPKFINMVMAHYTKNNTSD